MKKTILCALVIGAIYIFAPSDAAAQEGCKNYLGRPNQSLCTTQKGYDECAVLLKQGKRDLCVWTGDPATRIERKTPADAEASLLKQGCIKTPGGAFNCGDGKNPTSASAYIVCIGYKNFGSVAQCAKGRQLDLLISNEGSGEFAGKLKEHSTSLSTYSLTVNGVPPGTQKIAWKITSSSSISTSEWENPPGLIAAGEVSATAGTTNFKIDASKALGNATKQGRRIFIHAFAVKNNEQVAVSSHVNVIYAASAGPIKIASKDPVPEDKTSAIYSTVEVVEYKPPVFNSDDCAYILTKQPPKGEFKIILEKIDVKTVGTRFRLCKADIEKIKNSFSTSEKIGLALQDLLQMLKKGYNWVNSKYNVVEKAFVDSLAPYIGAPNAMKVLNSIKAVYGYNPYYGDFDQLVDTGRAALKSLIKESSDSSEENQAKMSAQVDKYADAVKFYANGGDDPNQFFRMDPETQRRPAVVILRVTYTGKNNPSAKMTGGKRKLNIEVMSGAYKDKNSPSLPPYPPTRLFIKTPELPNAAAGTTFLLPVYLDYTPTRQNDPAIWGNGWSSAQPGTITVDNKKTQVMVQEGFKK